MFHGVHGRFETGTRSGFKQVSAGPAQALHRCVEALRRGDASVIVTSWLHAERSSLLTEIVNVLGNSFCSALRIDAAIAGRHVIEMLKAKSVGTAPDEKPAQRRRLIVIDNAEMLDAGTLTQLAHLAIRADGSRIQFLLCGTPMLVPLLCAPSCAKLWRGVRLIVTLMAPDDRLPASIINIDQLRIEIARTEAKLAAQKRVLALFTNPSGAANIEDSP